jgi:hypothetical protein
MKKAAAATFDDINIDEEQQPTQPAEAKGGAGSVDTEGRAERLRA